MSKFYSYLHTASIIIEKYKGETPLAVTLKHFFGAEKKYGSRDRKEIAALCYQYYRVALAFKKEEPINEQLLMAALLCGQRPYQLLEFVRPEWEVALDSTLEEKKALLGDRFDETKLFPCAAELSENVDATAFAQSFLKQPRLFLRLRPGKEAVVADKLTKAGIGFDVITPNCLALPNASKIDEVLALNKEAVVQDYNSQQVGEFIEVQIPDAKAKISLWDCCAASGGKSIMLSDSLPNLELTVSDIRQSIMHNLKQRFQEAGIKNYKSFLSDLTSDTLKLAPTNKYDIVIADVPCTGSGTWPRTPEQLVYFKADSIETFVTKQRKIVSNVLPQLKSGGLLAYITCSVFKRENEENVAAIQEKDGLELVEMKILEGWNNAADTMFVAVLRKL